MADQETAIKIDNVSKDFILPHERVDSLKSAFVNPFRSREKLEMQHALKNISFEIKKGEFFGIVGRNGSGKSTLLKIIAGIYQPSKGSVKVNGRLVPFIELGVGFNPELTGRENVYLNGALMGFSEREVDHKYGKIVEFAELERFMDQKLKNYSSGMQVRLAFSVATILADSDILLIDEVLAVGDADFQRKCFDYFKKLKKDKKTVIFVSHDMDAIKQYCDRAILIDSSEAVFEGSSEAISKEYLRLFLPEEHRKTVQDQAHTKADSEGKWGSGGAEVTVIHAEKEHYTEKDKEVKITVKVKTDRNFEEGLLYGITIKNQQGQAICGTNSRIIGRETKTPLQSGVEVSLEWKVPNVFNEGTYIIEPALSDPSNMNVIFWWDDASDFAVRNAQKTPYVIAPKFELKIAE